MTEEFIEVPKSRIKQLESVASLADALWNDPKVGMTIKERYKEMNPNANIPEVVVAQSSRKVEQDLIAKIEAKEKAVDDKISAWEKKNADKEAADESKQAEASFASEVEATKAKYKLTQEGMEKVFARMKEKNNPDVEAAAAWVTDHEVKAAPTSGYNDSAFNPYGSKSEDKSWELLNKNPFDGKFAEQEINRIAQDFAGGRAHLYGPNGMGGEL